MKKANANGWPHARAWAAALLVAGATGQGRAEVMSFSGAGVSEDNFMYGTSGFISNNYGVYSSSAQGGAVLAVGKYSTTAYRSLIRFDVTGLSNYQSIDSATLTLTYTTNRVTSNRAFDLRLLLVDSANAGWVEGDGGSAAGGESCWSHLAYDTTPWQGGAGIGNNTNSSGVAAILDAVTVYTNATVPNLDVVDGGATNTIGIGGQIAFTIDTVAGLAALVSWTTGGLNAGFLLATDELSTGTENLFFASSEHANSAWWPTLSITYTIPEPSTFALLGLGAVALLGLARRRKITG